MSLRHPYLSLVLVGLTALVFGASVPLHALGAPTASQLKNDRAKLERSIEQLDAARASVAEVEAKIETNSRRLDGLMADQDRAEARLNSRVNGMYRTGETTFISVLMSARSYEVFASGWALLRRINKEDAAAIRDLKLARERAARAARELLDLQTQAASRLEGERRNVAAARKRLAANEAARAEYEQRVAATTNRPRPASTPARESAPSTADTTQQLSGSGAWRNAVASHYGRSFTGGSASGTRIGPYSMICAHKTLPFGTLVEFEYGGKRAVARVVDRGPFTPGRTFDLGPGIVRVLDFSGVQTVRYRVIAR